MKLEISLSRKRIVWIMHFNGVFASGLTYVRVDSNLKSEFDNYLMEEVLGTFNMRQSLSGEANPYNNAVAET